MGALKRLYVFLFLLLVPSSQMWPRQGSLCFLVYHIFCLFVSFWPDQYLSPCSPPMFVIGHIPRNSYA